MDFSKAVRNPKKVHDTLVEVDNQLITKTGCTLYFPEGYMSKGLAVIGNEISVLGVFAIFIDDHTYGMSQATAMANLGPNPVIETVMIEGVSYYSFTYKAGQVVMNTEMVINRKLVNAVMDFFIDYGHSPWTYTYLDMAELFSRAGYFNHMDMGSMIVQDMICSVVSRSKDDVRELYRLGLTSVDQVHERPQFIPQRNIALNTQSNLSRIHGSELSRATKAMLLAEEQNPEVLEEILIN